MDMSLERRTSDVTAQQTSSDELIKLICKLRWIGMEDEAEPLMRELSRRRSSANDSVVAAHAETD